MDCIYRPSIHIIDPCHKIATPGTGLYFNVFGNFMPDQYISKRINEVQELLKATTM